MKSSSFLHTVHIVPRCRAPNPCLPQQSSSLLHTVHIVPRCHTPNPCLPQQQDIIPHVVKNLSLALLKMGKSLPETCWADHWRSIKMLLLHLVGFYFTLPTLMMHGQTQFKFSLTDYKINFRVLVWKEYREKTSCTADSPERNKHISNMGLSCWFKSTWQIKL